MDLQMIWMRLAILFLAFGAIGARADQALAAETGIDTVGLYIWRDTPDQHAFWKDCGYNLMQFCDTGWHFQPSMHKDLYAKFAREVEAVRKAGFKTDVILFSNIAQWKGEAPTGSAVGDRFNPRNREALKDRLFYLTQTIRALKAADSFTFFAGDPGGAPPEIGPATPEDWLMMAREVQKVVSREAPQAGFNVNTWAITQWKDFGISAWDLRFWHNENRISEQIIQARDFIGPRCGIQLPLHNYYRSLAMAAYAKEGQTPELYPTAATVAGLRRRGTGRVWGWPYFIVDEADDGYIGPIWNTCGQTQAETRYIHKVIRQARELGLNGLIANFSFKGYQAEALNTYAFARFTLDPKATPESVIDQFAGFIATPESAPMLGRILRLIENHSTWQASLPAIDRLPDFDCGDLTSAWLALRRLETVAANPTPVIHLSEPPAEYLKRVRQRLEILAAEEKIPESSRPGTAGEELFCLSSGNWAGDATTEGGDDKAESPAADRAAAAVSSADQTGIFPMRLDLPLELRRNHEPKALGLMVLRNNTQTNEAKVYWDGVCIGPVNAYTETGAGLAAVELPIPASVNVKKDFAAGVHVLSLAIEKPTGPGYLLATFKVDSIRIKD